MNEAKGRAKYSGGFIVAILAINAAISIVALFTSLLSFGLLLWATGGNILLVALDIGTSVFSILTAFALLELAIQFRELRRNFLQ